MLIYNSSVLPFKYTLISGQTPPAIPEIKYQNYLQNSKEQCSNVKRTKKKKKKKKGEQKEKGPLLYFFLISENDCII